MGLFLLDQPGQFDPPSAQSMDKYAAYYAPGDVQIRDYYNGTTSVPSFFPSYEIGLQKLLSAALFKCPSVRLAKAMRNEGKRVYVSGATGNAGGRPGCCHPLVDVLISLLVLSTSRVFRTTTSIMSVTAPS